MQSQTLCFDLQQQCPATIQSAKKLKDSETFNLPPHHLPLGVSKVNKLDKASLVLFFSFSFSFSFSFFLSSSITSPGTHRPEGVPPSWRDKPRLSLPLSFTEDVFCSDARDSSLSRSSSSFSGPWASRSPTLSSSGRQTAVQQPSGWPGPPACKKKQMYTISPIVLVQEGESHSIRCLSHSNIC